MFTRVAPRYDAGNALMTLGLSRWWRGEIVRRARLFPGVTVLDLATGTGQLARDVLAAEPSARVIGADLTPAMLEAGRRLPGGAAIPWTCMDAHRLPLPDESIDVVTHGYLLRYLDLPVGLREQYRILKQGGRMVALETSPGAKTLVGRVAAGATTFWPQLVGKVMGQRVEDYDYLQRSSLAFSSPSEVVARLRAAGFVECGHRTFFAGMLAVYWGVKPLRSTT